MISSNKDFEGLRTNIKPKTFFGLSTDEKLTKINIDGKSFDIENGCTFIEIDTATIYFYDADAKEWIPWGKNHSNDDDGEETLENHLERK